MSFPEVFTPNGDGENDKWVIRGIENYGNNHLYIYNRWGNLVYEKSGYANDWEGLANVSVFMNGKQLPVGVYFWILEYGVNKTKNGSVFIER
jgi:gliding motility-associated-like protein